MEEEIHICYLCGNKAEYQLKNKKWCCKLNARSCESVIEKIRTKALNKWQEIKSLGINSRKDIPKEMRVEKVYSGEDNICYYCGKEAKFQFVNNKWCCCKKVNSCPEVKRQNYEKQKDSNGIKNWNKKIKNGEEVVWNKGLTKENNDIIKKRSILVKNKYKTGELIPYRLGKKHNEEMKKKISNSMKKFLEQNPNSVPYKLNHSSNISYPERYFKFIFIKENIDLKHHLQVGRYQLDFYNIDKHKYVEIDGESHFTDKKTISIDKRRTIYLAELGWKELRVRWSMYCKLNYNERVIFVNKIKEFVNN